MSPRHAAAILTAICVTAGTAAAQQSHPRTAGHAAHPDSASAMQSTDSTKKARRSHHTASARGQKAHRAGTHTTGTHAAGTSGQPMSDSTRKSPGTTRATKP